MVYGIYDFIDRKQVNFISLLGVVSTLLTGIIAIVQLPPHWIAVKEAAIPAIIGVVVLGSLRTKYPLVRKLLYNENIINIDLVDEKLQERKNHDLFEKLLVKSSYLLSASFFLSAVLNYGLAKYILKSEPGTVAFNEELGQMYSLSYPVIVLPSFVVMIYALWQLQAGIKDLTGLKLEDIFKGAKD